MHTDTHSSSVISDISHFPSCYLQPSVDIPKASRAEPETDEGGSINSSSTQPTAHPIRVNTFLISPPPPLNMHEIKYSGLRCLLSDRHCFEMNQLPAHGRLECVF